MQTTTQPTDDQIREGAKDWRDGLTPEQVATVEKAARAMWAERPGQGEWGDGPGSFGYRDTCRVFAYAALRAIGVIPEPKVPTRGEEIANHEIGTGMCSSGSYWIALPNGNIPVSRDVSVLAMRQLLVEAVSSLIDAALAKHDAEIGAAREVATAIYEDLARGSKPFEQLQWLIHWDAPAILAAKGGQPK